MLSCLCKAVVLLAVVESAAVLLRHQSNGLPRVDLGYTLHEALASNDTGGYYNFSNIRFAAPPTGPRRFRAPRLPATAVDRSLENGGAANIMCPQATPTWTADLLAQGALLEKALASGNKTLYEEVLAGIVNATDSSVEAGTAGDSSGTISEASEDCLFLDMVLPHSTWENRLNSTAPKAPVLVWLYGGGYVSGDKRNTGSPSLPVGNVAGGLVTRSVLSADECEDVEPTIIVLPNYRLGLFGWLGGETVVTDGRPNAGLFDQKLALNWVQEYIHLFGGDPTRVTVMGESAGAGSIEHHITAHGGRGDPSRFARAILQSPTFYPQPANDRVPENVTKYIMELTNTTSLAELREVPSDVLMKVNELVVAKSNYGFFKFGPVVDRTYVPALPGQLLLEGSFHKDISIMLGHNTNEAFLFTPPTLANTTPAFDDLVAQQFPEASSSDTSTIEQVLYPPVFSGTGGYVNEYSRQEQLYMDSQFVCNNLFLAQAESSSAYWYNFNIPPAVHGQDLAYTWASYPPAESEGFSVPVATAFQEYILSFVASGVPKASGAPNFGTYGSAREVLEFNEGGIALGKDNTSESRCAWWQRAPYAR